MLKFDKNLKFEISKTYFSCFPIYLQLFWTMLHLTHKDMLKRYYSDIIVILAVVLRIICVNEGIKIRYLYENTRIKLIRYSHVIIIVY